MAVPVDSGAPSAAVIQPKSVAFSRLPVGVRCLLKGKYSGASCGKVFDGGLLAGTFDVEHPDFSRKSHFGKIVEPAR